MNLLEQPHLFKILPDKTYLLLLTFQHLNFKDFLIIFYSPVVEHEDPQVATERCLWTRSSPVCFPLAHNLLVCCFFPPYRHSDVLLKYNVFPH